MRKSLIFSIEMAVRFNELDKALAVAVVKGDIQAARDSIMAGADVLQVNNAGHTLLMFSLYQKHLEMSKFLIEQGVSLRAKDNSGWSALMHAVAADDVEHVQLFVQNKAPLNDWFPDGITILMRAAMINAQMTDILLKGGVDKDVRSVDNLSALDYALLAKRYDSADVLLKHRAYETDLDRTLEMEAKIEEIFREDK